MITQLGTRRWRVTDPDKPGRSCIVRELYGVGALMCEREDRGIARWVGSENEFDAFSVALDLLIWEEQRP